MKASINNIEVSIDEARQWYNSDNETLRDLALRLFDVGELKSGFRSIKTFKDACDTIGVDYEEASEMSQKISQVSKASAAMFKLGIVRKALNIGQDLHLTRNPKDSIIWYPENKFVTQSSDYYVLNSKDINLEIIGKICNEGTIYNVLGGSSDYQFGEYEGVGNFVPNDIGGTNGSIGFLGCASKEIANHFGTYFGMLITKAKYGDLDSFEIIQSVYIE